MHHVDTDGDDRLRTLPDLVGRRVALRHRVRGGLPTDAVGELGSDGDDAVVGTPGAVRSRSQGCRWWRCGKIPPPTPRRASWAAVRGSSTSARTRGPHPWTPARGVAAARGRRFHRPGERGARPRRPRSACGGRPGRRARLRRRARDRTAGPRPDRVTVGPRGDGGRLGARAGRGRAEVAVLVVDLDRPTGAAQDVQLADRPSAQWWALALGREPTPDERFVLDPRGGVPTAFGIVPGIGAIRAAHVVDHLHLSRLAVRPDARRAGVATRLTAAAAAVGSRAGRALGRAPGRAAEQRRASPVRGRRCRRAPPLPLPGAAAGARSPVKVTDEARGLS